MIFELFRKIYSRRLRNNGARDRKLHIYHQQPFLLASVLVTGLVLGGRHIGGFQALELVAFDRLMQMQQGGQSDPRLLIVGISEADIQNQQQSTMSDQILSETLSKLQEHQPKVIGLDLYRDIPQPPGHQALQKQLQADNVIVITELGSSEVESIPPPPGTPADRVGFNDLILDPDGVLRRNFMFAALGEEKLYSFSFRLSLTYLADQAIELQIKPDSLQLGAAKFIPLESHSGGYQTIDAAGYQVLLNYRAADNLARQISLTDVLKGQFEPEWVKDKIVLIGTTARSAKDVFYTPLSSAQKENPLMSGVLVHAHMTSQILSAVLDRQPLFWYWPEWGEALWIWAWSLLGGVLAWRFKDLFSLSLSSLAGLGGLLGIGYILFVQAAWIPLAAPVLALVVTGGIMVAYKVVYGDFHDPLTGLPNRAMFLNKLQQSIAQTRNPYQTKLLTVLSLDIDRFKLINENFGHRMGDQFLVETASRVNACLPVKSHLARVGGDEFAILLNQATDNDQATKIADQLQKALALPVHLNGQEISTTVSVGIVLHPAGHIPKPEDLLRDAQTAMYRAKDLGKSRQEVFATDMRDQAVNRFQLEIDLRQAIEQQQFLLYYQPLVFLKTNQIAGFEALVRWRHPERGFVYPSEFIPVAEETGLIIPMGEWILEEACRQMYEWRQKFPMDPPLLISVNLSPKQFAQPDLVGQVERILRETQLDSRALKLEITESMAMDNVESAIAVLQRLKALNIQLSIDDFGTGYSSLSYLHRFPTDTLKVDRAFVSRMEDSSENAEIVKTIISLGHNLGMDVVAEGTETAEQSARLRDLDCEYGQGYFFSKPLPQEEAEALLLEYFQLWTSRNGKGAST
ncbi:MAG: EAL domain-containing protein [Leptolyngbyaceae cyanobacterium MO_188.B28]|nr:EAL domain-containing protein [Leptolyngbyaceae cyanobacterium MO_188.B28]